MRVLLPDLPEFRALSQHDEHGVPGVTFDHYRRGHLPDGEADGVVLWLTDAATRTALLATPGVKWVLTLTAGIEHVQAHLPPGAALFNASRLHDRAVAVHALSGMLAAARGLHRFRDAQRRHHWDAPALPGDSGLTTLDGAHVVLWGHGHIGRNLEELLAPHGAHVHGIRSTTPTDERDELLAQADWVVLLLPSTPDTRGIVNAATLRGLKRGAWLVNVGRGNLVVTDDLLNALNSGQLGGAILDVTDPEPLPDGHPLWDQPNVILTPHIASTTTDLVARGAHLTRDFLIDLQQGHEPDGRVTAGRTY
ncbi:D-isomer specific 2-hydroxyacid dehydrogenase [Deinococcus grandis]|uniref:D-isomer specific 2-hydroxyacid dehydrogenase n=1 Tax=Deinococcus grandis TaxID=57498 RepID=A0A100HKF2_9DEIO|nr:NAD(P)-dependent oxidoreductase [Deinococcus grandis]BBN94153.1 2-hydroxyacid dehydrogenase [Deinococcus grandis]GAQ22343.1 D-isomer specific 2-hydroxyacid dehydrogenase [Deinococcus grandis]